MTDKTRHPGELILEEAVYIHMSLLRNTFQQGHRVSDPQVLLDCLLDGYLEEAGTQPHQPKTPCDTR